MTTNTLCRTETDARTVYYPARVNIHETEGAYVIEAEMPGVPSDGYDVQVEDNTLTMRGTRPASEGRHVVGRRSGGYARAFNLSDSVDVDRVEAAAKDGVLTVTLHKVAARLPRKIDVSLN